ncbi:hypothetical protein IKW73_00420 [Candidatus Saccharibacteria bacterium]|nr:hypothetical protein [Candidatus Saccharibacteria bacterium]
MECVKKFLIGLVLATLGLALSPVGIANADSGTSISISPVTKTLVLKPNEVYEDIFNITNDGDEDMEFEIYASPYSYVKKEGSDDYQLNFTEETLHTQITKWITFKNLDGEYVTTAEFVAKPHTTVAIKYRISTPSNIPSGGQYAVLFARTITEEGGSGVRANASPGMIIYGVADGKTARYAEIGEMKINQILTAEDGSTKRCVNASTVVKNYGNVDFAAAGIMEVKDIFGNVAYKTSSDQASILVLPDTERVVSDAWENTPGFGIFNVSWTTYADDQEQTITSLVVILSPTAIIVVFLLLTIITICVIMAVRKRKE